MRHPNGKGDYKTLDVVAWFRSHSHYLGPVDKERHAVRCPWSEEHSTFDSNYSTSTVVWEARERLWPNFKCLHDHCRERGIRDVLMRWPDAERFCAVPWIAPDCADGSGRGGLEGMGG